MFSVIFRVRSALTNQHQGIYLADMSSKSANYCASYDSDGYALLLLCEAELGKPMQTLTDASYEAAETAKEMGAFSTWGQGQTAPKAWKDAGCIHPSLAGATMVSALPSLS
jgi:poly [ADP-ribose] polymerase